MSDNLDSLVIRGLGDWNGHYDDPNGFAKVEARRAVYDLTEEGVRTVDWDEEAIRLIGLISASREIEFADIGCSYPHLLQKMISVGYRGLNGGPLYGVEPNTRQFGGLGYWQPTESTANARLENLNLTAGEPMEGVKLVRATAQELPFSDGAMDIVSLMFSAYHIPEEKQPKAFEETKRVLKKDGALLLATSGDKNKEGMRVNELKIAECLTKILGHTIFAPKPLNAGFTSEKALDVLTTNFDNLAVFHHEFRIVVNSDSRLQIILNAYRSLIDMYTDDEGNRQVVTPEKFDKALDRVVGSQVYKAAAYGAFVADHAVQDLFVASDSGLSLPPDDYKILKAA